MHSALEKLEYSPDFSGEVDYSGSGSKINMKAEVTLPELSLCLELKLHT
jgi:hypothetical protein